MYPCHACKRHVRETEIECPFCRADLGSGKVCATTTVSAVVLTAFVFLGTSACSRSPSADDTAGTTTSQETSTEASTTTTTDESETETTLVGTDTEDETDDTTTLTTAGFYAGPESDWGGVSECDPFIQDCPEGEKCVPYASTGGTWDANKCVPITGDGQPGDPCVSGGIVEATDDCDGSGICWNLAEVDDQLVGVCTPFCEGTADDPECAEGQTCMIANDGSINVCIQACDPVAQNCTDGLTCAWVNNVFACVPVGEDPSPIGQPCDAIADCPFGAACVLAELVPGCEGSACCAAFCSLSMPTCVEPTSECVPFFEDPPPAGYEDIGICIAP
jgi:hypothetical protein